MHDTPVTMQIIDNGVGHTTRERSQPGEIGGRNTPTTGGSSSNGTKVSVHGPSESLGRMFARLRAQLSTTSA